MARTCVGGTCAPRWHAGSGDPPFYKARPGACVSWPERICLVLQERFEKRFGFFQGKSYLEEWVSYAVVRCPMFVLELQK